MSTLTVPKEILFTAEELARITAMDEFKLNHLLPDYCGVPGHWRLVDNQTVYTVKGVEELVAALSRTADHVAAHSLRTALRMRTERPEHRFWFQTGDMA